MLKLYEIQMWEPYCESLMMRVRASEVICNSSDASAIQRKTKQIRGFGGFGFQGTHDGPKEIVNNK